MRVALRIYLVGLAQMGVVAAGFIALAIANRPEGPGPMRAHARFVARTVERALDDPRELAAVLDSAREDLHMRATVLDAAGQVIATNTPPGTTACEERGPRERCVTEPLATASGRSGRLDLAFPGPPPPPFSAIGVQIGAFVLVVVGVSSLLLGRSLTRPLRRMSAAARAFGGGDRDARVALERRDELGDVARAFDEMAERVTQLLRAEKELLANVSHELRTPLARIRVALDLASEGDAAMARESLADIAGDLEELERLISDVLMAARLDLGDGTSPGSGIPPLRRQTVDVAELLAVAASRFRTAHPSRPLRVDVAGTLPTIDGDPVLLRRVVDNLLENAHKYSERPEAEVELRASSSDGVAIEVCDKGSGISPEDLPRVFRPFFRADKSRTRATGGLGLGLALAKRIVEAHGGTIRLESAPREGTRAHVHLPPGEAA